MFAIFCVWTLKKKLEKCAFSAKMQHECWVQFKHYVENAEFELLGNKKNRS